MATYTRRRTALGQFSPDFCLRHEGRPPTEAAYFFGTGGWLSIFARFACAIRATIASSVCRSSIWSDVHV